MRLALACLPFSVVTAVAQDDARCEEQARQILDRLQAELVGQLNSEQRGAAIQIVLDVCQQREAQLEVQVEQAVQQAREEEQASSWWQNSGDKEGNKRLRRKQH